MTQQVYPPNVVVRTLLQDFFPYRGLTLAPRGLAREASVRAFTDDDVIGDMKQFFYVRLDALRAAPRGGRDWVVVLVLAAEEKYSHHGPDLRKLLEGVEAERPAKEGRLDELIVVAEEDFLGKKNLMDVIHDFRAKQAGGADPEGAAPFYCALPYHNFALVIPRCESVPPHRILSDAETAALLERERITLRDLGAIYASDPPVVWLGGRAGQVVEITRRSQTAAVALYYRRIDAGA